MARVSLSLWKRIQIAYYARKVGFTPYELSVIYRALQLYLEKKQEYNG